MLPANSVVVVDDCVDEAKPFLQALWKSGISALYFSGDHEELPGESLNGVRLLILDMDLGTGETEDDKVLSPLLSCLDRLISKQNGPFMLIVWSGRPELVEPLIKRLKQVRPDMRPAAYAALNKAEYLLSDSGYDVSKLMGVITAALNESKAVNIILNWETRVYEAALKTTGSLCDFADKAQATALGEGMEAAASEQWISTLDGLLAVLASAAGVQDGDGPITAKQALVGLLDSLLLDHVENSEYPALDSALLSADSKLPLDVKGSINRMILLSQVEDSQENPSPGSLYFKADWKCEQPFPIAEGGPSLEEIVRDTFNFAGKKEETVNQLVNSIVAKCVPVLVEITPSCDRALKKAKWTRLLVGLLVPTEEAKHLKRTAGFSKVIEPLYFDHRRLELKGTYTLVLYALYICSVSRGALANNLVAFRLRNSALTDIQAWFGSHAARPGIAYVPVK